MPMSYAFSSLGAWAWAWAEVPCFQGGSKETVARVVYELDLPGLRVLVGRAIMLNFCPHGIESVYTEIILS
jgi:hypothetical protein